MHLNDFAVKNSAQESPVDSFLSTFWQKLEDFDDSQRDFIILTIVQGLKNRKEERIRNCDLKIEDLSEQRDLLQKSFEVFMMEISNKLFGNSEPVIPVRDNKFYDRYAESLLNGKR